MVNNLRDLFLTNTVFLIPETDYLSLFIYLFIVKDSGFEVIVVMVFYFCFLIP